MRAPANTQKHSTLLATLLDLGQRKEIGQLPKSPYWVKGWQTHAAPVRASRPEVNKFFVSEETTLRVRAIAESLTEEELLRIIQQTRLPFPELWVEFAPITREKTTYLSGCGIHIYPMNSTSPLKFSHAGGTVRDFTNGIYMQTWLNNRKNDMQRQRCGIIPGSMVFLEDKLSEVENFEDFLAGIDKSGASTFAFNQNLLKVPQDVMDDLETGEISDLSIEEEMLSGSIRGLAFTTFSMRALNKELFVFLWLLTARIIKVSHTQEDSFSRKTKTRGIVKERFTLSATEIDLIRVKEIRDTHRKEPTGRHISEHAVMGHWCQRKKSGKKYWREAHTRGTQDGPTREGYKL